MNTIAQDSREREALQQIVQYVEIRVADGWAIDPDDILAVAKDALKPKATISELTRFVQGL